MTFTLPHRLKPGTEALASQLTDNLDRIITVINAVPDLADDMVKTANLADDSIGPDLISIAYDGDPDDDDIVGKTYVDNAAQGYYTPILNSVDPTVVAGAESTGLVFYQVNAYDTAPRFASLSKETTSNIFVANRDAFLSIRANANRAAVVAVYASATLSDVNAISDLSADTALVGRMVLINGQLGEPGLYGALLLPIKTGEYVRVIMDGVDEDAPATHEEDAGESYDLELRLTPLVIADWDDVEGTAQVGGSTSTIKISASDTAADDAYNGWSILVNEADPRRVTDFVASTKIVTIDGTWAAAPDASDTYRITKSVPACLLA